MQLNTLTDMTVKSDNYKEDSVKNFLTGLISKREEMEKKIRE